MSRLTHADLDGFLADLLDTEQEIDTDALRRALGRNQMVLLHKDGATSGSAGVASKAEEAIERRGAGKLWAHLQNLTVRAREGAGPLEDMLPVERGELDVEQYLP